MTLDQKKKIQVGVAITAGVVAIVVVGFVAWFVFSNFVAIMLAGLFVAVSAGLIFKCVTGRPPIFGIVTQFASLLLIAISVCIFFLAAKSFSFLTDHTPDQLSAMIMALLKIDQATYDLSISPWLAGVLPIAGVASACILTLLGLLALIVGFVLGLLGEFITTIVNFSEELIAIKNSTKKLDQLSELSKLDELRTIRNELVELASKSNS